MAFVTGVDIPPPPEGPHTGVDAEKARGDEKLALGCRPPVTSTSGRAPPGVPLAGGQLRGSFCGGCPPDGPLGVTAAAGGSSTKPPIPRLRFVRHGFALPDRGAALCCAPAADAGVGAGPPEAVGMSAAGLGSMGGFADGFAKGCAEGFGEGCAEVPELQRWWRKMFSSRSMPSGAEGASAVGGSGSANQRASA